MFLSIFTLLVALSLSAIAAYYSILGLTAIFAAATLPIMIMGGVLEVAKVTVTVWLHTYWDRARWPMKTYLTIAVIGLAALTSMGIFGFLSKAHSDQSLVSGDVTAEISIYDERIRTSRENIDAARRALKQMDEAVDQVMSRSTTEQGADKAVQIRRSQNKERSRLQNEISIEQKKIAQLNEQAAPIRAEVRKVEAEVGPIKYIAALAYGDNPDTNLLEKAVRWVIILIVIVFDPLALMMVLAGTTSLDWVRKNHKQTTLSQPPSESESELESSTESREFDDTVITEIPQEEMVSDMLPESDDSVEISSTQEVTYKYLQKPWAWFPGGRNHPQTDFTVVDQDQQSSSLGEMSAPVWENGSIDEYLAHITAFGKSNNYSSIQDVTIANAVGTPDLSDLKFVGEDHGYVTYQGKTYSKEAIQKLFPSLKLQEDDTAASGTVGFGIGFPTDPSKGDMFLRVDNLPTRLYKYNGTKWIEIDKSTSDSYAYNQGYIEYLITAISAGNYDPEMLSNSERLQLEEYLRQDRTLGDQ